MTRAVYTDPNMVLKGLLVPDSRSQVPTRLAGGSLSAAFLKEQDDAPRGPDSIHKGEQPAWLPGPAEWGNTRLKQQHLGKA